MVAEGKFREDLYYRLNVVAILLPPLRNRREDVPILVRHFLAESCNANHRDLCEPDEELWKFLESYHWPGNVRQLRNCIESMVVLAHSTALTVDDLPAMVRTSPPDPDAQFKIPKGFTLEDIERVVVRQTLRRFGGRRTEAARSLGISVRTLQRKLKRWESDEAMDDAGSREDFTFASV
jgi:DNA-binding NtrC family response regulator